MVDHRNETPSSYEVLDVGVWDRGANIEAWGYFLAGREPDGYAAPLHAEDLRGLPPMYIDVGTVDLFRDEILALVTRLAQAGVEVEFHLYPGAYHASEMFAPGAELSRRIWDRRLEALRRALRG
jgi:acetyl esterase/lipase